MREGLERVRGKVSLFKKLLRQLQQRLPADIDGVRQSLNDRDRKAVANYVHTIKGAAATLGVARLAGAAEAVENAATNGDALEQAIEILESECDEFCSVDVGSLEDSRKGEPQEPLAESPSQDGSTIIVDLDALTGLLKTQDIRALATYEALSESLRAQLSPEQYAELDQHMSALKFPQALSVLREVEEQGD